MKLAIVHDWFITIGGAERVLMAMHRLWPAATIHFLIGDSVAIKRYLPTAKVKFSSLNKIPLITKLYPYFTWAMPGAIEAFNLAEYEVVISSSVIFSKGIIVRPETKHIAYIYSTPRQIWDRASLYEHRGIVSEFVKHKLRIWDFAAAQRPDQVVAISQTVSQRIKKYWSRDSIVVQPPLMTEGIGVQKYNDGQSYWLLVARLVPHKQIQNVLEATAKSGQRLFIVGSGPLLAELKSKANKNVKFFGTVDQDQLNSLYAGCDALILPNNEDFGLTAIEAMTFGRPVLALRQGGATETILEGLTGEFFDEPIPESLAEGINRMTRKLRDYDSDLIKLHSRSWSLENWQQKMQALINYK